MRSEYWLAHGPHATPEDGRCAMEWVSYLAGEPHSDQPACVSPALRAFCVAFNDGLDKNARQRLRPYLARTIGTTHDGLDEERSWMAMDWLIRVYAPAWLELAGVSRGGAGIGPAGAGPGGWRSRRRTGNAGAGQTRYPRCPAGSAARLARRAGAPSGRGTPRSQGGLGLGSGGGLGRRAGPGGWRRRGERARACTRRSGRWRRRRVLPGAAAGRRHELTSSRSRRAGYDRRCAARVGVRAA